ELSNNEAKRHEREALISLPNVLCLIINEVNKTGHCASMDEIKTNLKVNYPEFPLPQDNILYTTIGTLMEDNKLMLKNGGYTTLPCQQATHVKAQVIRKDHSGTKNGFCYTCLFRAINIFHIVIWILFLYV
ncbi:unnamed protein product, partial [Didymodactylos carnosus]